MNKNEIMQVLRTKYNVEFKKYYTLEEVHALAKKKKLKIEVTQEEITQGWLNSPKGLLQVLYERHMINKDKLSWYTDQGRKTHMGNNGIIQTKYKEYMLQPMMQACSYFKNEESSMQMLFKKLSSLHNNNIYILTSPKYHCEIAGLGIEYAWGLSKKKFRRIPLSEKKNKATV